MVTIGEVQDIYRYPVKSFQGERIPETRVNGYGLAGDRSHVFLDHSRSGKHLSAKQVPRLLEYSARYREGMDGIDIVSKDGRFLEWDSALLEEIEALAKRELSLQHFPVHADELAAVDASPALIIMAASLDWLGEVFGQELDVRRFRPNFVVRLQEDKPLQEVEWIGRTIRLGDAEFLVTERCERCSMITIDPERVVSDPSLLKKLTQVSESCFGVYAEVIRTGTVRQQAAIAIQ